MKITTTLAFIILAALLAGCVYWALNERGKRKTADEALKLATNGKLMITAIAPLKEKYIDPKGAEHAVFETTGNVNKKAVAVSPGLLDTITKDLKGVKPGEVQYYIEINSATTARALKAEKERDSLQRLTYYFRDKYLSVAFRPPADSASKGEFDFTYNAVLKAVQYSQRSKVLGLAIGTRKTYTDISSEDPRTTINGAKVLSVEQKQPAFGIRAQAVGTYSFTNKEVSFGPGLQFDAGRFSVLSTWYFNSHTLNFNKYPTLTGRYDFFR